MLINPNNYILKYNVENFLKQQMPNLIDILGDQKISWTSVNGILERHISKARNEFNLTGKPVERDATFYSILIEKYKGSGKADGMFDFFNKLFGSLNEILSEMEKKPINKVITSVLTTADKDYLNFIGELATLNKLMLTQQYDLINIEEPIHEENDLSADIFLRHKADGKEILIEVLNLHLEIKEFKEFSNLEYHLKSKLEKKKADKDISNSTKAIFIQPVVWTKDEAQLNFVKGFYLKTGFKIENVNEPLVYATFKLKDGSFEHHFEYISTIFSN